jgi:SAM-dependent methyltransferase
VASGERWLDALWPVVRSRLPPPPAQVVEVGCGPLGGFVPMLRADGYRAVGVDPAAPEGDDYRQIEVERVESFHDVDAVVAVTSLHHVGDPGHVIDRIAGMLTDGGTVVVVEWDWEEVDEATAQWCFERLGPEDEAGWLHRRRDEWMASGEPWDRYLRDWARAERLHAAPMLLRVLKQSFGREQLARGPYFFPDLPETSIDDEQAAIDAGAIKATRIDYVGRVHART